MTAHSARNSQLVLNLRSRQINADPAADDASTSSTITVDRTANKPLNDQHQHPISAPAKKSVRFDSFKNISHDNTLYCEEDSIDFWYAAEDYQHFKSSTMFMAKEISRSEKRNMAPFSFQRVIMRTYEVCCNQTHETNGFILSADEKKRLTRWAAMATTRLGLERWSCRAINRDKSYRRNEVVNAVLDAQDAMLSDCEGTAPSVTTSDDHAQRIRESSERISRTSRLFARCLGEAHSCTSSIVV